MPAFTMSETEECERRFQAAVKVIQSLPKNGSYRPSYEVMLRFYGLYKQAVCGLCTVSRPGFWDPVGRYKWEAWNQLGNMSRESAMTAYVDEMKKVAQEVIDTMQIDEKTASFFHYFEPLYHVIHDMPRPPEKLLSLSSDIPAKEQMNGLAEHDVERPTPEPAPQQNRNTILDSELQSTEPPVSEGQGPTSDSENEVFCDSLEQLDTVKATQVGTEHCGEGALWRDPLVYMAYRNARWVERFGSGAGSGRGGGGDSDIGPNRLHDDKVQQQIILALQQLREDMQSVMERLDVVEGLATANAQNSQWRSLLQLRVTEAEDKWWSFEMSGRTLILLLVWPLVTHSLMFLLRQRKKKINGCM